MTLPQKIKGFLIDLDGVVYIDNEPIAGAIEAIMELREQQIPFRFVTNTSTKSQKTILQKLLMLGIKAREDEIFSAPIAAKSYLIERGISSCRLILQEDARKDLYQFKAISKPEAILIGDIGPTWDYALMNELFNQTLEGAEIIALHKNKYWMTKEGMKLDIGAFIAGLEYATGKEAMIVGKPSRAFFKKAAVSMGLSPQQVAMIGDDIDADIHGAQQVGIKGILVKTGKFREDILERTSRKPDLVIPSLGHLPRNLAG